MSPAGENSSTLSPTRFSPPPRSFPSSTCVSSLSRFSVTGMVSGCAPVAPGPAGSLVGLAIYLIPGFESPLLLAAAAAALFFVGVFTAAQMEKALGEDPPVVVVDEVVGMWISLLLLPKTLWVGILSFLFFRLFDIIKPPPATALEKYGNG